MEKTALLFIAGAVLIGAQNDRPPKRGDVVVVTGCIVRSTIESNDTRVKDGEGAYSSLVTYRLAGEKKLIERIKTDHDGHVDVLTGKLKSELPMHNAPGKRIGNTGITVGIGQPPPLDPAAAKAMPVLEVTEIEHTEKTCRP